MTRKRLTMVLSAALLATTAYVGLESLTGGAWADDLQTAVDTRRATMKDMAAQMKAIYAVVTAKSGDMADMQKRALQVQADAAKIPTVFPAGTSTTDLPADKTHALPAIWEQMDKFKTDAANLETQAGKLAAAAQAGDMAAFAAQFGATGKACGTCHTDFRAKLN
jgi:cytochrome c556